MKVYTIGASKKSAEEFFSILKKADVEKLLDIRLNNKSQLLGFSKGRDLRYFCEKCHGIRYEHVPTLAPTEELLKKYQKDEDWPFYEVEFLRILESRPTVSIFEEARGDVENISLLCSEPAAHNCHRRLVAEYVSSRINNAEIIHL